VVSAKRRAALKRRAVAADRSISAELRRAVRQYLSDDDPEHLDEEEQG
jgi:hypothetical protein